MAIALVGVLAVALAAAAGLAAGKSKGRAASPSALDPSFGSHVAAVLGRGYRINALALQPDGKIVVAGDLKQRSGIRLIVARLTSAGRLDRSFNHGRVLVASPQRTGGSIARGVAVQRDGKIVVAGRLTDRTGVAQDGMLAERLTASGGLDRGFGNSGVAIVLQGTVQSAAPALALQRDGKIVLAGNGPGSDGLQHIALARLDQQGRPDRGFGSSGVVIAQGGLDLGRQATTGGVAIQSDGKIVLAGGAAGSNLQITDAIVARFTSRGGLDRGFGSGGRFLVHGTLKGGGAALFHALTLGHGGIVAAGSVTAAGATPAYALLVRLSGGGRQTGLTTLQSERGSVPPSDVPGARGVAFARGGTIVAAGSYLDSGRSEVGLWSLSPRGSVISSGSTRTILSRSLGLGAANALAIDRQGRIVVAGTSNNLVAFNGFVLRYHGFGP